VGGRRRRRSLSLKETTSHPHRIELQAQLRSAWLRSSPPAAANDVVNNTLPQLGAAIGAILTSCSDLATRATFANATFTAASAVAAGALAIGGNAVPSHCLLTGHMFDRASTVDGNSYTSPSRCAYPTAGTGAKLMIYHGTSDPIFSSDDRTAF
jgi:feruloyl esterase